jgi:hypothetical protein
MEVLMLGIKQQTQMDKMKAAVREAVAYIDEVAADERLRSDLRSAAGHGGEARDRIRKDVSADGVATRLVHDRKLRKKVRAMLDDLDSAGDRLRRRQHHRLRNGLLVLGGIAAVAAAIPNVRRWIVDRVSGQPDDGTVDVGMTL